MLIDLQLSKFVCRYIFNTTSSLVVKNSFIHITKHYWGKSRHSGVSFSVYLYICVCVHTCICLRVCINNHETIEVKV